MKVTVLGLGLMGAGMAKNLIAKGFDVTVYNRDGRKAAPFAGKALVAADPADAAKDADIMIAMLADDGASRSVWLDGGALAHAKKGAVVIESSTISPHWARELAAAAGKAGLGFLDAPVTGSKVQAEEGTLRFLVGGSAAHLAAAQGAFDAMGSQTLHMGDIGAGITMKLINNFLCGVQVATTAEALVMAEKSGLNSAQVQDVLMNGAPGSPLVKAIITRITNGNYAPNFFPGLMAKDLDYAAREAADRGLTLETAAAARQRFLKAVDAGLGEQDIAAVVEPMRI
jgi:3-hydroxyisobutyrate dehydrogenase